MSEPPRETLLLTTSYPRSEQDFAGHFVRAHARIESRARRPVRVLAFGRPDADGEPLRDDPGVEITWLGGGALFGAPGVLVRLAERRLRALCLAWPLARALWALGSRSRYEAVIAHFLLLTGWPLGVWFARRGRSSAPLPLMIVAHGSDVRLFERLPRWLRRHIVSTLLERQATIQFVSAELRQRMTTAAGRPELEDYVAEQSVAPAALDLPDLPSRALARAELGISSDELLLLVVGRLTEDKRVSVAIGAAGLVPGARVVAIGDGPLARELAQRHEAVAFTGALGRKQALTWMRAADLLLSASRLEGAPTVVREARLLGVPVVAKRAGDLADWSRHDPELWLLD